MPSPVVVVVVEVEVPWVEVDAEGVVTVDEVESSATGALDPDVSPDPVSGTTAGDAQAANTKASTTSFFISVRRSPTTYGSHGFLDRTAGSGSPAGHQHPEVP